MTLATTPMYLVVGFLPLFFFFPSSLLHQDFHQRNKSSIICAVQVSFKSDFPFIFSLIPFLIFGSIPCMSLGRFLSSFAWVIVLAINPFLAFPSFLFIYVQLFVFYIKIPVLVILGQGDRIFTRPFAKGNKSAFVVFQY